MRNSYGSGYEHRGRPSPMTLAALAIACLAVGLSIFVIVGRDEPGERRGAVNQVVPTPSPSIKVWQEDPPLKPANDTTTETAGDEGTVTKPPRDPRPACRNSTNPACGRFYWSPRPAQNKPLRLEVSYFPANPQPGETVTYTVTAKDGDAAIQTLAARFGDGKGAGVYGTCVTAQRYGAWTPPAAKAGAKTMTFTHVYKAAGTYKASFVAESGGCGNPYSDAVTLPVEMVVATEAA